MTHTNTIAPPFLTVSVPHTKLLVGRQPNDRWHDAAAAVNGSWRLLYLQDIGPSLPLLSRARRTLGGVTDESTKSTQTGLPSGLAALGRRCLGASLERFDRGADMLAVCDDDPYRS